MYNIMYETSRQSRFNAQYWMLGAGALGQGLPQIHALGGYSPESTSERIEVMLLASGGRGREGERELSHPAGKEDLGDPSRARHVCSAG